MKWWLKAAVQGTISQLPYPEKVNRLFQRYVTRSLGLNDDFWSLKFLKLTDHMEHWRKYGNGSDTPVTALELGTGWYPIVPIGLRLLGCESVYTVDQTDHVTAVTIVETIGRFVEEIKKGAFFPSDLELVQRMESLRENTKKCPKKILSELGIYAIVGDARAVPLDAGSIDLFVSNNTLEHIPEEVIREILTEFSRLSHAKSVGSHWIDMGDHYADFDGDINQYNFLRYPSWQWKAFNNRLQYQNRLRISDFRELHRETSWNILSEEHRVDKQAFASVDIADEFLERYSADDLAVHAAWLISTLES